MGKQQGRKVSIDLRKSLAAVLDLQTEPAESPGSFLYWNAISAVIEVVRFFYRLLPDVVACGSR